MTEKTAAELREDYLARLDEAMRGLPHGVASDIRGGIAEELDGLDAVATAERIDRLGDPRGIAREAEDEVPTAPPVVFPAPAPAPSAPRTPTTATRGFAIAAALTLSFGGIVVPVVGWFVGAVLVSLSPLWRTWEKAVAILVNAKTHRVSVCNAAETFLVHSDVAEAFLPRALAALRDQGVTVHGDARMAAYAEAAGIGFAPVTDEDWATEYYSLDIAAGVVDDLDAALTHIRRWSSGHTEAIVSDSASSIQAFITGVDSAAVMVNASTRFTDGGEFGFGAEIGISTQKLHARGPMGLAELTSTTYVVTGDGHIRA